MAEEEEGSVSPEQGPQPELAPAPTDGDAAPPPPAPGNDLPPPTSYHLSSQSPPFVDPTWTLVDALPSTSDDEVDPNYDPDEWEEDEISYVTFDFGPHMKPGGLTQSMQLLAPTSATPYARVGTATFRGHHENLIGTELLLQRDASGTSYQPFATTSSRVVFLPVALSLPTDETKNKPKPKPKPREKPATARRKPGRPKTKKDPDLETLGEPPVKRPRGRPKGAKTKKGKEKAAETEKGENEMAVDGEEEEGGTPTVIREDGSGGSGPGTEDEDEGQGGGDSAQGDDDEMDLG